MRNQKTKTLVECALMVALSTILSFITLYQLPQGGDITAVSMMPLVLASFLALRRETALDTPQAETGNP